MARRAHEFLPKKPRRRYAVRWHMDDVAKPIVYGVACKCLQADNNGYLFQSLIDKNVNFAFTVEEYDDLLTRQDFDLEPNGLSLAKAQAKLDAGVSSIKELKSRDQMIVDLREIAIWKFQELESEGLTSRTRSRNQITIDEEIQPYVDREARKLAKDGVVTTIQLPGAREFERWIKNYEKKGKLGIIPRRHRCGNRKPRYGPEEVALTRNFALRFLRGERPTRELIYDDLKAEVARRNVERRRNQQVDLRLPDKDYLRLLIARLAPFDVDAGRHLDEHAKRRFHPSSGGVPGLFRPLQRVEVDDWDTHLYVLAIEAGLWESISPELKAEAETVRCNLSAAICCVTRVLPAVVLSLGPHSVNIATLLRMCMSDKTALAQSVGCETPYEYRGNPYQLVGDEGSAILNARTNGICEAASVEYLCPQIETPQQRAKIERVFQTLEIRSLLRFSGRAFSNPAVRGKYEAYARACVTVHELAAIILRFIVDHYHNVPHDGLDGATPRYRWLELTKKFAPRSVPGKPHMRRTFGEPYTATLQPEGIDIFGNWYTSPAVQKLYRDLPEREYTVIVDGEDLGGVSLNMEQGWLDVPGPDCMNGVSATVWDMALARMRRENKHVEKIAERAVLRAIGFAQEGDRLSRQRLGIQYRLKTPEELEELRNSIGHAVRFAADRNPRPSGPVDMFAGGIPVGTKAPPRNPGRQMPPAAVPAAAPATHRGKPKPKLAQSPKPQPSTNVSTRKPPRAWKPKERK